MSNGNIEMTTPTGPAVHYYVLTSNLLFKDVVYWLHDRNVKLDIHLNRTRFELDSLSKLHTEFCLRWSHACSIVDDTVDLATGLPQYSVEHIS
jgi:hypothetical protein